MTSKHVLIRAEARERAGVIDSTKVVRLALENAVSVASVLLLTEATLTETAEPKGESAHHAGYPEE